MSLLEEMERGLCPVVVPIFTLPAKYAFPVVVAPPEMVSPPICVPLPMVVDAEVMRPPLKVMSDVVALFGNGSCAVDVASVPQLNTPAADALTSQDAAFKLETMRFEVDAVPVTARLVVVALVLDELVAKSEEKMF